MPHDLIKYSQEINNDARNKDFYDSEKFKGASVHVMPIIRHAYYMKNQALFDFETEESEQEMAEEAKEESSLPEVVSQPSGPMKKGDSEKGIESGSGAISVIEQLQAK